MEPALHDLTRPSSSVHYRDQHPEPAESNAPEPEADEPIAAIPATEQPLKTPAPAKATKPSAERLSAARELIKSQHPGVSFDTPEMAKILNQLANKEAYIGAIKSGEIAKETPYEEAAQSAPTKLEELQRELYGVDEPEPVTAVPAADQPLPAANQPFKFNDIGDKWKGPQEAFEEWNAAWAEGNLAKVAEIDNAKAARQFQANFHHYMPMIEQLATRIADARITNSLGDVLPEIRNSHSQRQFSEDKEYSIKRIKGTEIGPEVDAMLSKSADGELEFGGQTFEDTPFNRIAIENPWILEIEGKGKNVREKTRDAIQKQLLAAHSIYKTKNQPQPGIDPAKTQQILDAGKTMAARESADLARQGLNAGNGSTGLHSGTPESSYTSQLSAIGPGELPLSSLKRK